MSCSRITISISISGILTSALCFSPAWAADKNTNTDSASDNMSTTGLSATITKTDFNDGLDAELNKLTHEAISRNDNAVKVDKLVKKYRSPQQKAIATGKEFVYSMAEVRGFGPSKEAANVLLEKVSKIKSLAGAEYIKQRIEDNTHTQVVQNTLQIAMALDTQDPDRRQRLLDKGYAKLKELTGEETARKTLETLTAWSKSLEVPEQAFKQSTWDVDQFQENLHGCTSMAVHSDPIVRSVVKKIKKYNRSKAMVGFSSLVEAGTDVATLLAPGFAIPAAVQMAQSAFVTSTGGTEETKLVTEMYYAKTIESRWKRLNEENQLALTNYETALRTKSPTLMACSEAVLQNLIGADRVQKVLGQTVLANVNLKRDLPIETSEAPLVAISANTDDKSTDDESSDISDDKETHGRHSHASHTAHEYRSSQARSGKHSPTDMKSFSVKALDAELEDGSATIYKNSNAAETSTWSATAGESDAQDDKKPDRPDGRRKRDIPLTTADAKKRKSDFTLKSDETTQSATSVSAPPRNAIDKATDEPKLDNPGDTSEFWSVTDK